MTQTYVTNSGRTMQTQSYVEIKWTQEEEANDLQRCFHVLKNAGNRTVPKTEKLKLTLACLR